MKANVNLYNTFFDLGTIIKHRHRIFCVHNSGLHRGINNTFMNVETGLCYTKEELMKTFNIQNVQVIFDGRSLYA